MLYIRVVSMAGPGYGRLAQNAKLLNKWSSFFYFHVDSNFVLANRRINRAKSCRVAVGDLMFLGIQYFDFAKFNQIFSYFVSILPKFNQFTQINQF